MRRRRFETEREHWFDTGILAGHYHLDFRNRCPHGHAFWNHPNGARAVEGYYNRGIRAGVWRWTSDSGKLIKTANFGSREYKKQPAPEEFSVDNCTPQNTILLDEEYTYRYWFWMPDRSIEDTVSWWQELDAISPWFMTPIYLPGILIEAKGDNYDRWNSLEATKSYYYGHINEDEDSCLRTPSGEFIFAKRWQHGVS